MMWRLYNEEKTPVTKPGPKFELENKLSFGEKLIINQPKADIPVQNENENSVKFINSIA